MDYKIFKLNFLTATHFGRGGLMKVKGTLSADTIFSAMCTEAEAMGELERLIRIANADRARISDGLPYIGEDYYVPKPLTAVAFEEAGDSRIKKAVKKLEYIPVSDLEQYLSGSLDVEETSSRFHQDFGRQCLVEKASVKDEGDAEPYAVGTFRYGENSGLYLCVGYEGKEVSDLVTSVLESLSYSGIGGKRSSGYGRFRLVTCKTDPELLKRLTGDGYSEYESLSVSLPSEDEPDRITAGARFRLVKRSGFVASESYSKTFRKKKDCYIMEAGAVFQERFNGCIMDVSDGGSHPVYRYAKAFLMGVR